MTYSQKPVTMTIPWKTHVEATTAGAVEHVLGMANSAGKAKYGARSRLVTELLQWWVARETGRPLPHISTLEELLKHRRN